MKDETYKTLADGVTYVGQYHVGLPANGVKCGLCKHFTHKGSDPARRGRCRLREAHRQPGSAKKKYYPALAYACKRFEVMETKDSDQSR